MHLEVIPFEIPRAVLVLCGTAIAALVALTAWLIYRVLKNG
jgi:uncharacterized membrane protein YccC